MKCGSKNFFLHNNIFFSSKKGEGKMQFSDTELEKCGERENEIKIVAVKMKIIKFVFNTYSEG